MTSPVRFRSIVLLSAIAVLLVLVGPAAGRPTAAASTAAEKASTDTAVFFAADGLRQDIVARYAADGLLPTMSSFLKKGVLARGNGLLTQAPPNTGAGWYSLATGAWPGVHASTNNTFHINGQPFANRTAAFDPNVLQAESIAQSAERGGLKVAQVEWAGGRNATIAGPTIDFRTFQSGRGVTTNFTGQAGDVLFDDVPFITAFGLQFDHPAGFAGQAPFPGAAPTPATGWTGALPATFSPARGDAHARARLRDRQVRAERVDLRQHERRHHQLRQGPVLADEERRGHGRDPPRGRVRRREGHDPGRRPQRVDRGHADPRSRS